MISRRRKPPLLQSSTDQIFIYSTKKLEGGLKPITTQPLEATLYVACRKQLWGLPSLQLPFPHDKKVKSMLHTSVLLITIYLLITIRHCLATLHFLEAKVVTKRYKKIVAKSYRFFINECMKLKHSDYVYFFKLLVKRS